MIVGKFYPPRYPLFDFQQSSQVSNLTYTNRISFMTVLAFDISLKTTTVTAKVCNLLPHFSTHPIQPQPSSKKHQSPSPRSPQPNISTLQLPQKKNPGPLWMLLPLRNEMFLHQRWLYLLPPPWWRSPWRDGGGSKVWKSKPPLSFLISTILMPNFWWKNPRFAWN